MLAYFVSRGIGSFCYHFSEQENRYDVNVNVYKQNYQYLKTCAIFLLKFSGPLFGLEIMLLGHPWLRRSWQSSWISSPWKAGFQNFTFRTLFLIFWKLLCHYQNVFAITWEVSFWLWLIHFIYVKLGKHSNLIVLSLIVKNLTLITDST